MMGNRWAMGKQSRAAASAVGLSVMCALVVGCGSGSSGGGMAPPVSPAAGTVTGQVVSLANSAPVSGATVKTDTGTATTAADGKFTVPAPAGDRVLLHVEMNGFAEAFPVVRVTSGQTTNLGVKLVPTDATATVSVAAGDTVAVPNSPARVTIPANGVAPQTGGTPAETVTVSLTPINPSLDTNLMPGGFSGISAGGGTAQPIESFGALLVDIRDSTGTRYTLARGKTATIRIPLGTNSTNPPATVPLWFFDETARVWKEEGTATLQGTAPDQYYEGTVAHFSYWNAALVLESIFVTGCVKDANGQPVAFTLIQTEGIDYTGAAIDVTAADGSFQVAVRKNSRAKVGLFDFDPQTFNSVLISNLVTVGPSATDIHLSNCLVKKPRPLTITTTALTGGTVGVAYNQTVTATGGVPSYVWSLNTGSNPLSAGLALNPSGVISGTPTAASTTTITIKVTDSAGGTATKGFTLTIAAPGAQSLSITTVALPVGTLGIAYNVPLAASGGAGAKSWSVSSGALPSGLALNASTGVISGTPTAFGPFTFTVQVQDSGTPQQSAQQQFSIPIIPSGGDGGGTGGGKVGGGGGTVTVSGAPASVRGTFVSNTGTTGEASLTFPSGNSFSVTWEENSPDTGYGALLVLGGGTAAGIPVLAADFSAGDTTSHFQWSCHTGRAQQCNGLTINRMAGTATLSNVVLTDPINNTPPITLNGTLTFTPF